MAKATGASKYVICNADEGDPGAFMDRSVLEGDPHRVLEGMAIAAYAVGAEQGYIYVRGEYPLAIKRLKTAIKQAERAAACSAAASSTRGFSFRVDIRIGAGAFVCGEETALIASIEGKRGTPRPRPPYPADSGPVGQPHADQQRRDLRQHRRPSSATGGDWFAGDRHGEEQGHQGLRAGRARSHNTGLIEVPMGITLREIVFDIGGGIPGRRAVQGRADRRPLRRLHPGRAPRHCRSTTSRWPQVGSIMGSGGMIVMDETSCMVDVARFFMEFCMDESCGKCVPCRVGTVQMHELLRARSRRATATRGGPGRCSRSCATWSQSTSLCGLGQTAPNPVLSTLRYFRDEYDGAHRRAALPGRRLRDARRRRAGSAARGRAVSVKTLTIDGQRGRARREDQTILDVARENGIPIPTLCHLDGLSRRRRLPPLPGRGRGHAQAAAGLRDHGSRRAWRSRTDSERLQTLPAHDPRAALRRAQPRLRGLRLQRPLRAADAGATLGMDHVRFPYQSPALPVDASHERFVLDHNRCILCTRCVRVCDEIEGAHTWDVTGRGVGLRASSPT